jgi:hypothetical protein
MTGPCIDKHIGFKLCACWADEDNTLERSDHWRIPFPKPLDSSLPTIVIEQ